MKKALFLLIGSFNLICFSCSHAENQPKGLKSVRSRLHSLIAAITFKKRGRSLSPDSVTILHQDHEHLYSPCDHKKEIKITTHVENLDISEHKKFKRIRSLQGSDESLQDCISPTLVPSPEPISNKKTMYELHLYSFLLGHQCCISPDLGPDLSTPTPVATDSLCLQCPEERDRSYSQESTFFFGEVASAPSSPTQSPSKRIRSFDKFQKERPLMHAKVSSFGSNGSNSELIEIAERVAIYPCTKRSR